MFNLSGSEIIVILLLALVVLGPEKLPDALRRAGKTYAELKKVGSSFQDEMKQAMDEPMREMRETADLLRKATSFEDRPAAIERPSTAAAPESVAAAEADDAAVAEADSNTSAANQTGDAANPGDDAPTAAGDANGDGATPAAELVADAGEPTATPEAPATPETPVARALRGGSSIDRRDRGEDGASSA